MLKRTFYLLVFVIISSLILGCAGSDEIFDDGVVLFVGSVSVKSQETDANGELGQVIEYPNRDGIFLTLSRESEPNQFIPVDTTTSVDGKFNLVADEYGRFRISGRVNDYIKENHPTVTVWEDSSETYTLSSPVTFGPYSALDDSIKCELPKPNPASNSTIITYSATTAGYVTIEICNTNGTLIKTLLENHDYNAPDSETVEWDFTDNNNAVVPNDIYFYVFEWVESGNASNRRIHIGTVVKE